MEKELFGMILPEGLLNHFIITDVQTLGEVLSRKMFYQIYLEEKNELHSGYDASQYESKGFTEVTIQDFPLRGKAVYLVIKRRRWRSKINFQETVRNDYGFAAEGSKLTRELADFLKGTGKYKGRYD